MIPDADGLPKVGRSARKLGVRTPAEVAPGVEPDVSVTAPDEVVQPDAGGMSMAPDDPANLAENRRPPQVNGGVGKDPVWMIESNDLGPELRFNQDQASHGTIEPVQPMTLAQFELLLAATRTKWVRVIG